MNDCGEALYKENMGLSDVVTLLNDDTRAEVNSYILPDGREMDVFEILNWILMLLGVSV